MFSKVLIADDLGSINQGVVTVLDTLGVKLVDQVQYCDDAYLKIKGAILKNKPYQLLITDLSFKSDYRDQKYPSGEDLIAALRVDNIDIPIIVYSVEDRLLKVRSLFYSFQINAYVCKGRRGIIELGYAIETILGKEQYISLRVEKALSKTMSLEIDEYDIELLKKLSDGLSQDQISIDFKKSNISPNSLSSIEKRINKLKIQFQANNAIHLVAITKDLGLI